MTEQPAAGPGLRRSRHVLLPTGLAMVAGLLLAAGHRLGGDMPGVYLRIQAFREGDFVHLPQWFGGVPNLTYSILLAPLGALLSVPILAGLSAASTVAGVCVLGRHLPRFRFALLAGSAVISTLATLAVGRLTYSSGTAFGVWVVVLLAADRRAPRRNPSASRTLAMVALATLAGAASPVAGLFVAMTTAGHLLPTRRVALAALLTGAGLAPAAAVNLAFPSDGGLDLSLGAGLAIGLLYASVALASRSESVRATAVLGIIATAAVTIVDTQVTYIIKRLPETFGSPALAATGRRVVGLVLICLLTGWNLLSLRTGFTESGAGERNGRAFAPLVTTLHALGADGTIEVVPTALHWETWYVAREFAIARGWERQADADHGPVFYDDTPLEADEYAAWLAAEDVAWVALAGLPVDHSGKAEAELLATAPDYLTEVSDDGLWTIWAVDLPD